MCIRDSLQGDGLRAGLPFDPFVTVEHELDTERRVSAHFDGEVTPLGVDEGKVVMIDVGPGLLALQVGAPLLQVVTFQTLSLIHI